MTGQQKSPVRAGRVIETMARTMSDFYITAPLVIVNLAIYSTSFFSLKRLTFLLESFKAKLLLHKRLHELKGGRE